MSDDQLGPVAPQYSRGAETLMRAAIGAMGALVVSMVWILASPMRAEHKSWAVTVGLSAIAAMLIFAGHTRAEGNKTRAAQREESERSQAAQRLTIELAAQGVREEIRTKLAAILEKEGETPDRLNELTARIMKSIDESRVWRTAREVHVDKRFDEIVDRLKGVSAMAHTLVALAGRVEELEAQMAAALTQQETLAEMVVNQPGLVLDVSNSDAYELGKRVGREEVERELGGDQTP